MDKRLKAVIQNHCYSSAWFKLLDEDIKKQIEHANLLQLDIVPMINDLTMVKRLTITNHAMRTTLVEVTGFSDRCNIKITETNPTHISP